MSLKQQVNSKLLELQEIYNSLPKIDCQQKCQECCSAIIFHSIELKLLESKNIFVPHTQTTMKWGSFTCSALNGRGQCSIYRYRPIICRLFGLTPLLKCPFGCIPDKWVSEKESRKIIAKVDKLLKGDSLNTL